MIFLNFFKIIVHFLCVLAMEIWVQKKESDFSDSFL